jgi:hypothetical protein
VNDVFHREKLKDQAVQDALKPSKPLIDVEATIKQLRACKYNATSFGPQLVRVIDPGLDMIDSSTSTM